MAEIIRMPKLSDTMTDGVIIKWHKKIGDKVKAGEVLAEIETDKATMEFESFQEGILLYIGVEAGKTVPVDSILAILGKEGEDIEALKNEKSSSGATKTAEKSEIKDLKIEDKNTTITSHSDVSGDQRIKISPLAKKIAQEHQIDVQKIEGSAENGRIIRRDIEAFLEQKTSSIRSNSTITRSLFTDEPLTSMRRTIARRLSESKQNAPHYYLMLELDMDQLVQERTQMNAVSEVKISINDFIIKATALALLKHPKVNSSWLGDQIRYHQNVNIGVAVAVEDGLLVPVVRDADQKKIIQISLEVKGFAQKAKEKKLQAKDWENSTFTISNLGMMGIEAFTSIINTPDSAILSVGAILEKPVIKNGQIVIGHRMKVTLACDHRTVDGATGAAFLQTFKQYIEKPLLMLVG